ncbi:MAG: carboxypeptidase-like regulatory domain-containing protein [Marinilabilia sp.]
MKRRFLPSVVWLFALLLAGACSREVYNISWDGVVVNKATGETVSDARISASSTYQENIDETAEFKRETTSDEDGRFEFSFPKGFGLTVRTSASGYLSGMDYKVIRKSALSDTIFISPHPFNASLVVRLMDGARFSSATPFIRETLVKSERKGEKEKTEKWGFDFLNGSNTTELDSADVWVEVNRKNGQVLLRTADKGGIFPVYSSEDFLTHVTRAPESGYASSHLYSGDEAGFFVLCRNGTHIAKMVPEERICVLSYERDKEESVKETGIRFDYLFQPDLKNRLYFPVSMASGVATEPMEGLDAQVNIVLPD